MEQCRDLYNAALEERREAWRRQQRTVTLHEQYRSLTELRAQDDGWSSIDATMTRYTVLRRLDLAFKAFFRRVRAKDNPGYPRFKSTGGLHTLIFGETGWRLERGKLTLRGVGCFRVAGKAHRAGRMKGLRVIKRAGRWYAHVLIDVGSAPAIAQSETGVGIDVGIKKFATLSDGTQIEHPQFLRESLEVLKRKHRSFSLKRRGSQRWTRERRGLARLHQRIANRRKNFVNQLVAGLVGRYGGFAVEDLDLRELIQKRDRGSNMRRAITDSSWSHFMRTLAYKAEEAGKPFVRVNPKGTTQRCSRCGSIVRKGLDDRIHECHACGLVLDRDVNAALNILDLGRRSAGLSAEDARASAPIAPFVS